MNSALVWFKKYWLVTFATIAVALFTGLPTLVFFQEVGNDFNGLYPVFNGDALYYHSRVQDMHDGNFSLNHQYFYEQKEIDYPQGSGAEYFIYGITKLFGVSNPALQVVLDFLAPAIIFLLTYLLLKRFTKNEYTAVLFPLVLYTVVMGGVFKPMRPQITLPLLLIFLLSWVTLIIKNQKKIFYSVLSGILLGLLILTYYYWWSFVFVVIGIYALILLMNKSYKELKYHGLMAGIGILIGLPYFLRVWNSLDTPFHADVAVRIGVYYSHLPESYPRLAVALVWVTVFVLFSRYYKIEQERKTHIIAVLLIANVIYPNHQIVTGIIIENALHWSWMPILIFGVSAHYMIGVLKQKHLSFNKNGLMLALVLVMFLLPAWRLYTFTFNKYLRHYNTNFAVEHQYYADVFNWINTNTNKEDVIYSDSTLMGYIPAYTASNTYNSKYAFVLPASDKEIIERNLLSKFFEPDFFSDKEFGFKSGGRMLWFFQHESEKNTHNIAGIYNIPYTTNYSISRERTMVEDVYSNMVQEGWNASLLNKYRVDYIIWDKLEKPEWNIEEHKELELVEAIGDVNIYKLIASK